MAREDRLWSPQMRKWMGDARSHGMPVRLAIGGGLSGGSFLAFLTDDTGLIPLTSDNGTFQLTPDSTIIMTNLADDTGQLLLTDDTGTIQLVSP